MSWTCDVPGSCGFWRHQIDLVLGSRLWALNKQNGCTMQAERWGVQLKYGIRPSPGGVLPNGADDRQGELRCCQTSYTHRHKNQGESPTGPLQRPMRRKDRPVKIHHTSTRVQPIFTVFLDIWVICWRMRIVLCIRNAYLHHKRWLALEKCRSEARSGREWGVFGIQCRVVGCNFPGEPNVDIVYSEHG